MQVAPGAIVAPHCHLRPIRRTVCTTHAVNRGTIVLADGVRRFLEATTVAAR